MAARREERPSRAFRRTRRYKSSAAAIGAEVRALRMAAAWTLEKAAERMGLDFRHLQQIEAGTVNVTLVTIVRIADAFGVGPHELLPIPPRGKTNLKYGAPGRSTRSTRFTALRAEASSKASTERAVEVYLPNPIPAPAVAQAVQKQIGRAIAKFRRAHSMTQAALARKVSVSVQYVQRVEAGKQNLTISSLVRFANALEVEPHHLVALV